MRLLSISTLWGTTAWGSEGDNARTPGLDGGKGETAVTLAGPGLRFDALERGFFWQLKARKPRGYGR